MKKYDEKTIENCAQAFLDAMEKSTNEDRVMQWFGQKDKAINAIGIIAILDAYDSAKTDVEVE